MSDASPPEPDRHPAAPHPAETERLYGQAAAEAEATEALASARFHHAWLIRGPAGIGKATLAYRLARRLIAGPPSPGLLGPAPEGLDVPVDCPVARRIRAGSEPRLFVLRRAINDKTGKLRTQIGIDEVRALRHFLELSAADGGWRAVIADSADEMTVSAANALLKSLEEPPPRTAVLLVSHQPARLLPTIRSRTRTLDLAPLRASDLAAALLQAGHAGGERLTALAELSGGSVGRAITLLGDGGLDLYARLVQLLDGARVDRSQLADLADDLSGRDRDRRFATLSEMTLALLGRLARAGVLGPPQVAVAEGEAGLIARAATGPAAARLWAEASSRIARISAHARAVNLDPAQTILDMFLDLDETLRAATAHASGSRR